MGFPCPLFPHGLLSAHGPLVRLFRPPYRQQHRLRQARLFQRIRRYRQARLFRLIRRYRQARRRLPEPMGFGQTAMRTQSLFPPAPFPPKFSGPSLLRALPHRIWITGIPIPQTMPQIPMRIPIPYHRQRLPQLPIILLLPDGRIIFSPIP